MLFFFVKYIMLGDVGLGAGCYSHTQGLRVATIPEPRASNMFGSCHLIGSVHGERLDEG